MQGSFNEIIKSGAGIIPMCNGVWENNKFNESSSAEIVKCCITNCTEGSKSCYELCEEDYLDDKKYCIAQCDNLLDICIKNCTLSAEDSVVENSYTLCANKIGCGFDNNIFIDPSCAIENDKEIMECCVENCDKEDCENHCKYLRNRIVESGLKKNDNSMTKKVIENYREDDKRIYKIFIIIFSILLLICLVLN